jgi:quinol monooxygenase YgiN
VGPDDAIVAAAAPAMNTVAVASAAPSVGAVHAVTYLEVRPSSSTTGVALASQYERETRADAGNLAVNVYQEIGRPNRFVITEDWQDQASFGEHERAAHTLKIRGQLKAIQRSPGDQRMTHGFSIDSKPSAAGPTAIAVVTHIDVPGARREEAETLLKRLAESSRSDDGHVRYDIYQQNEPRTNHFTVIEVWANQTAFEAHGSTAHAMQFREALTPMLGALYDERLYRPYTAR